MENAQSFAVEPVKSEQPTVPTFLAVTGGAASFEGRFRIEDSIEIDCEVIGELQVGGQLIIGESGRVKADVRAGLALIRGTYEGNLTAEKGVELTHTSRTAGSIETPELVIHRGAVFTGVIAQPQAEGRDLNGAQPEPAVPMLADRVIAENPLGVDQIQEAVLLSEPEPQRRLAADSKAKGSEWA